jgi:hypothetical protein
MAASCNDSGDVLSNSGGAAMLAKITKPLELYIVRVSPPCRFVWLYMLQVGRTVEIMFIYFYRNK